MGTKGHDLRKLIAHQHEYIPPAVFEKRKASVTVRGADDDHEHGTNDKHKFIKEMLEWQNKYRKLHGVPDLRATKTLTDYAEIRAKYLAQNNILKTELIEYGESVLILHGQQQFFSAEKIVRDWYNQKSQYDFVANKPKQICEAFTQMIWKDTREFGVGIAIGNTCTWIVGIYHPPGNYFDGYKQNVLRVLGSKTDYKDEYEKTYFENRFLEEHNKYRILHECPKLRLNRLICDEANERARMIAEDNVPGSSHTSNYGQNIFQQESTDDISYQKVIDEWYSEYLDYNFEAGIYSDDTKHFTQMIWKNTTDLGVGYVRSDNKVVIVCYYEPPGNDPQTMNANVPYRGGQIGNKDSKRLFQQDILIEHNMYRRLHGAPPLVLKKAISEWATEWAENLIKRFALQHRPGNKYGENIFLAQKMPGLTGQVVVNAWYKEKNEYDFNKATFSSDTAHFTQLVWVASKKIGIGIARSNEDTIVVCDYDPPGNVPGLFESNVLRAGTPLADDTTHHLSFAQECLNAHNKYRQMHGCPPLKLSYRLNAFALEWAKTIAKTKKTLRRPSNVFGENICRVKRLDPPDITGDYVVNFWYEHGKKYDYNKPRLSEDTRYFTQLIWKSTEELGVDMFKQDNVTYVVAYYSPSGNIEGGFAENVPPPRIH